MGDIQLPSVLHSWKREIEQFNDKNCIIIAKLKSTSKWIDLLITSATGFSARCGNDLWHIALMELASEIESVNGLKIGDSYKFGTWASNWNFQTQFRFYAAIFHGQQN